MGSDAGKYNCKVLDRRTGAVVLRRFRVGSAFAEQTQFCASMCNSFCQSFYAPGA